MKQPISIGKFASPYGVHGWIKIQSYTEPNDNILEYDNWGINTRKGWQTLAIEDRKRHGKHILAKIEGIDSPEAAKTLTNQTIYIERDQLPNTDNDEFYWSDLIGCEVETRDGQQLGTVTNMMDGGSCDIFVIEDGDKRHLIPHIGDYIVNVDITSQRIVADWDPEF